MQGRTEHYTQNAAKNGKEDIFPEYIRGNLSVKEAQHFKGRKLPFPLIDVDVVQVIEDHKGQHACGNDQDHNDHIQASQHTVQPLCQRTDISNAQSRLIFQKFLTGLFNGCLIRRIRSLEENVVCFRNRTKEFFIKAGGNVGEILHIVLTDLCHRNFHLFSFCTLHGNTAAIFYTQHFRCFFRQDDPLITKGIRFLCDPVSGVYKV